MKVSKKMFILLFLILICKNSFADAMSSEPSQEPSAPYRLFKTANIWTFIKLNTITGQMWQIQFDIQGDNRGAVILNSTNLAKGDKNIPGRFTLYPTSNIYTFILVDQFKGKTWQVQWSSEVNSRFILPLSE